MKVFISKKEEEGKKRQKEAKRGKQKAATDKRHAFASPLYRRGKEACSARHLKKELKIK